MARGSKQPVCELSVIGNKKQTFRILVQTADRRKVPSAPSALSVIFHQVQNCFLPFINRCGQNTGRLIHHIILKDMVFDRLSEISNFRCRRLIQQKSRIPHRLSAHEDGAAPDVLFDFAARAGAHIRKKLVQPHFTPFRASAA